MLEPLGLSSTAERVYRAMLVRSDSSFDELAAATGVPVEEVRRAIDALAEMALVQRSPRHGGRVRPTRPEVGLGALLARAEADLAARQRQLVATRAAVAAIAATHRRSRRRDELVRFSSVDAVRRRWSELAATARTECLSLHPGTGHRFVLEDRQAVARGVAVRAVYQDSLRNDRRTLADALWLARRGALTRTAPLLPVHLVIVDGTRALVPIDPTERHPGAVEVRSPGILAALSALFEYVWSLATPLVEPAPLDETGLDPAERQLLRLLGAGHTDSTAGRRLGLSTRTVQRMMAGITGRLGAESRFQAGVNAARRGWL